MTQNIVMNGQQGVLSTSLKRSISSLHELVAGKAGRGDVARLVRRTQDYKDRYFATKKELKELVQADKAMVAGTLFDLLAHDYHGLMKEHNQAAKSSLDDVKKKIVPTYEGLPGCLGTRNREAMKVFLKNLNERRELLKLTEHMLKVFDTSSHVILDPTVGDGEVTLYYLDLIRESIGPKAMAKSVIMVNDISGEMLKLAVRNLKAKGYCPIATNINFLDPMARKSIGLVESNPNETHLAGCVDMELLSQTLDVIKGKPPKRDLLGTCHDLLKFDGRFSVVGEDPSRFSISSQVNVVVELLFELVFDGMGVDETVREMQEIRDKGRLVICGEGRAQIPKNDHEIFSRVAKRMYISSSRDPEGANADAKDHTCHRT